MDMKMTKREGAGDGKIIPPATDTTRVGWVDIPIREDASVDVDAKEAAASSSLSSRWR